MFTTSDSLDPDQYTARNLNPGIRRSDDDGRWQSIGEIVATIVERIAAGRKESGNAR